MLDPVSVISIFIAVLVATIAGHVAYSAAFRAHIDRRVSVKLAQASRRTAAYKRQVDNAIIKAVTDLESQGRFIDDRSKAAAELCVKALEEIRSDIIHRMTSSPSTPKGDDGQPARQVLPFSVQAVRNRAEQRLVEQLEQDRLNNPQQGSKA